MPTDDRVPTQTGKPGKMGRHFPVREKSGNFEQTRKVKENHTKYWKNIREFQKNVLCYFLVIFKNELSIICSNGSSFQFKKQNIKKYWKIEKDTGKVREFCQSGKVGTLDELTLGY